MEPGYPIVRYEYSAPGGLLHIDVKKLPRFKRVGHRMTGNRRQNSKGLGLGLDVTFVCIDDASRVVYAETFRNETNKSSKKFLRRAVEWFAIKGVTTQRVMTDNGTCFKRQFSKLCARLGIKHFHTRPYTPRTNGKAERFIQTMLREWAQARRSNDYARVTTTS